MRREPAEKPIAGKELGMFALAFVLVFYLLRNDALQVLSHLLVGILTKSSP